MACKMLRLKYQKEITAHVCPKAAKAIAQNPLTKEKDEDALWKETDKIISKKIQRKEKKLEKSREKSECKKELSKLVEIESGNLPKAPQKITAYQIQMVKEREKLQAEKLRKEKQKRITVEVILPNLNHCNCKSGYENCSSRNISVSGIDNAIAALSLREEYTPEYERKVFKRRMRNFLKQFPTCNNGELLQSLEKQRKERKKLLAKQRRRNNDDF